MRYLVLLALLCGCVGRSCMPTPAELEACQKACGALGVSAADTGNGCQCNRRTLFDCEPKARP